MFIDELYGKHWVVFTTDAAKLIDVTRVVTDINGYVVILEGDDGTQYNWINILSVKRWTE